MARRDWRTLALAGMAAAAMPAVGAWDAAAQAPKAQAKAPEAKQGAQAPEAQPQPAAKKKKQDPAEAQRAIDAALRQLEAGNATQAVEALTTILAGGNLPPAIMAKALLYRGIGYRQQKKPAQAIADLTSALWLKGGLGEMDRTDALRQRASAYHEAGLTEAGEIIAAVPGASRAPARTASAGASWDTTASQAPASSLAAETPPAPKAPASGSSGWNIFGNWFGGGPKPMPPPATTGSIERAAAPAPVAAAAPPPAPAVDRSQPATSGWSQNTEVRGPTAQPIATAAVETRPQGRFRVQLGIVRTEDEARIMATKVKRDYGAALGAREPDFEQAVVGNMGALYRVRVGPYATAQEGQALCARLKGSGLDCLVVTQ